MSDSSSNSGLHKGAVMVGIGIYVLTIGWQLLTMVSNMDVEPLPLGVTLVQLALIIPVFTMMNRPGAMKSFTQWMIVATFFIGFFVTASPLARMAENSLAAEELALDIELGSLQQLELRLKYAGEDDEEKLKNAAEEAKKISEAVSEDRMKEISKERARISAEKRVLEFGSDVRQAKLRESPLRYAGAIVGLLLILVGATKED